MPTTLEVLFTPAEFAALPRRDLLHTTCVVFDVLRATSTMVTALANGAEAIVPAPEIADALAIRRQHPEVLLAGERDGLRITAAQTGGVDFDLGNSPREFTVERVKGRTVVMTTTNGTRALRACAHAQRVLIGSLLNLRSLAAWLAANAPPNLLLVCAGTVHEAAYEDALAAGGLCDLLWKRYEAGRVADSALMARSLYLRDQADLGAAIRAGRNGQKLLAIPELRDDVAFCARASVVNLVACMNRDGRVAVVL